MPDPDSLTQDEIRKFFESDRYPYRYKMARAPYEAEKARLQAELLKVQKWAIETGERFVFLFEGRDAAGKGGTIKRFNEHLNPRFARVVALNKPSEAELGQWYFQRYVEHLPTSGEMVFYDRSWYNRAGVERVMGFCTPTDYLEFMRQAPEFERMLVRSGIRLFKFWFSVTPGRAAPPLRFARNGPSETLEIVPHRQGEPWEMGRIYAGQGSDVLLYRHSGRALDSDKIQRQETRASGMHEACSVYAGLPR